MTIRQRIDALSEFQWRGLAYLSTRPILAFVFLIGMIVPSVAKALKAYEAEGSEIRTLAIAATIVPGIPMACVPVFMGPSEPASTLGRVMLFLTLLGVYFVLIAFWLTLWAAYSHKQVSSGEEER
jgi:uncharacterized membrane protein